MAVARLLATLLAVVAVGGCTDPGDGSPSDEDRPPKVGGGPDQTPVPGVDAADATEEASRDPAAALDEPRKDEPTDSVRAA